jgi:hypothetical protein
MNDSDFDNMLRSARGDFPLPASFGSSVWRRIENDAVAPVRESGFVRLLSLVVRPWGAVTGLAATVALGLWLGAITTPGEKEAQTAYANSISPFGNAHHR